MENNIFSEVFEEEKGDVRLIVEFELFHGTQAVDRHERLDRLDMKDTSWLPVGEDRKD